MRSSNNLFLVSNIPTPYRQDFYNALSEEAGRRGLEFETIFFAATEANRTWKIAPESYCYKYTILNSRLWQVGRIETYFSLRPVFAWLKRRPRITILAGAWHYPANILIVFLARLFRAKCWFWCEANAHSDKSGGRAVRAFRLLFYRACPGFLSPGPASDAYIKALRKGRLPIIRIPNAVERSVFRTRENPPKSSQNSRDQFLFVGELSERKGVIEMIDAFEDLLARNILPPSTVLTICGDGPLREQVTSRAHSASWLNYVGFHQGEALTEYWKENGALVLNTKLDPSPLVVNEAITYGIVPIVSSRAGNAADVEENSPKFNFVFEYGHLEEALESYSKTHDRELSVYRDQLFQFGARYNPDKIARELLLQALD